MTHNAPVTKGDPNRRVHPPNRKEKAGTIVSKLSQLGIAVHCPSDCSKDFESQLQSLDVDYPDFQKEKGRIQNIKLVANADISFDAQNAVVTFPVSLTQTDVDSFFVAQMNIERVERTINIRLAFPTDKFQYGVIQKALFVVAQNVLRLRLLNSRLKWIDFLVGGNGCANGVWSIDRAKFENHFDEAFADLQKCLAAH